MLALFQDKKYCNCIILFSCILWDFIVLDLVLNWWRIKHKIKISAISQLACKKFVSKGSCEKGTWEAYAESWRVKCQASFREYFAKKAISRGTCKTFYLEDFKCDFLTLHPHYPQKKERLFREKNPI